MIVVRKSGKIEIIYYGLFNTQAGRNIWAHCDFNDISLDEKGNLLQIITVNGQMEEATTRSDILHFFGQENIASVMEKSGNFDEPCLWQPC